ncbi:HlyD family efflux transporter periplasmic adaptor subunit [Rhodocytophaga aerolata]|uniref:HlyD family efflux transporter periplasmic adaptor subunit n=1 Tax=Rhodocytophaga aerolata TaxID=455078 RepID=A0ABT8RAH6_9BACT|nr:HlyD family efflux transporter periplasmic adaptor subunit [Rhodocytophaga aerolata]MDO1449101.1 HlyD family efflux transporter periplasmic adaptor subunit [Rhodocytophaga aerolata]
MDRVIEKKKWPPKKIMTYVGVALLVTLILASYFSTNGNSKLNVDEQKITISEIRKGSFQEFIPINGVVMPIKTIYLDAIEGGRVEDLFVEDGAMLEKDQPIMKLANTDLELDLANRETAVFDLITNMQRLRSEAEQNSIRQLNQLAEVDNALAEAERLYTMNKKLFDEKVIAEQEYKSSKNMYDFQVRRKKLTEQTLRNDSVSTKQRLRQMQESVDRTQVALNLMRKKADDLTVKAPVAGQLTSLNAEIGESKTRGQRLGQLDVLSGFKVRADIDEHYISRIFAGLKGMFTFAGKDYELSIKKIYTQVTDGRFQVDMEFTGEVPNGIRRGQTLQIRLALSDQTQAVLLPRGGFYQQTGGNWIYKLNEAGESATKVDIRLGRQNPEYYEVMEGLQPGDKVVTSSYENYGDKDELRIKNSE